VPVSARESATPLVSVVLPTYGRHPDHLVDAVASVREQTYEAVELVVVDDSPGDADLREAVREGVAGTLGDRLTRVTWLREGPQDGAGAARNAGMRAATGDLLAFLDDDDAWRPRKLARQVETLQAAGETVGLVYCRQQYVDEDGHPIAADSPTAAGFVLDDLLEGRPLAPFSTVLVRREVPERVGYIDESIPVLEDREWYLRIATAFRVAVVPEALTLRRTGSYDRLSSDWEALRDETYPRFLAKHADLAAERGWLTERRFRAWLARSVGTTGLAQGHYREARSHFVRSIRAYPLAPKLYGYLLLTYGGNRAYEVARTTKRVVDRVARRVVDRVAGA